MRLSVWPKEAALSISSDSKACQLDLLQLENAAMRRLAAGLSALAMLLVAASNASASAITISGTTAGCFGALGSCGGSFVDQTARSPFDFNGTDFSVLTTLVGDATNIALGTIHRVGANEGNFTGSIPFAFQLAFSLPLGAGGGPDFYTAQIIGQAQGGGGAASMDFDNTIQHVSFVNALGSGSFDFLIHDIAGLGKNDTITLFGDISNATLGGVNPTVDTPVPEPASLLLVGGGLMAVTARVRRKKA